MAEVIRMPRLSDTMAEGVIVSWNKKVGDKIKPGDVLAEVETDKATMELESYNEGILLHIGVEPGKAAKVDAVLAVVGKEGEDYKAALEAAGSATGNSKEKKSADTSASPEKAGTDKATIDKPAKEAPAVAANDSKETISLPAGAKEIRMPLLSDTMTEGKIIAWNKKIGDAVKADDVLAEVETDKATMEVVGYEEGTLLYTGVEAGKAAKVNEIIAIVGKQGTDVSAYVAAQKETTTTGNAQTTNEAASTKNEQPASGNQPPTKENPQPATGNQQSATYKEEPHQPTETDGRLKASPLAKKLAADKGIDISKVNGSGDGGRITKKDVDEYKEQSRDTRPQTSVEKNTQAVPLFTSTGEESHTDIPNTQMRNVIARRLGESMFSAPHFYLTMEINMDNAIAARNTMNEASPVKISFNDMLIKACATALRQHQAVNSSWMGDFIRQNHHIHIGSAVAMPEGLIVPVIKFADQKTLSQIAAEAKQLYTKAKDKKLQPAEFSGNTFTISNLGMMDIEEFTAIINPPDSCILAVGRIKEMVVRKEGTFDVTNIMKVTLSCDHRAVDGAIGAAFLQTLRKFMENPVMMLV